MSKVDQFESVFRAAAKAAFVYSPVEVGSVLVVSDGDASEAASFGARVRSFLSVLERGENVRWSVVDGEAYGSVPALLDLVERDRPGLICTYRHLHSDSWRWPYTLGEYVDVLTQVTTTPVLVMPHPEAPGARQSLDTNVVIAMTDRLVGDRTLVNWAARFTADEGELVLANVEDSAALERFLEVVSKIPSIDTANAREEVTERLLRDARDYMGSCTRALASAGLPLQVREVAVLGQHLEEYRRMIHDLDAGLLVMNTKDEDQLAMNGLAYPLAIEVRSIPLLLL